MKGPSEPEFSVKNDVPLFTLIADINSVQASGAKSISYQKFDWRIEKSNSSCVDSTNSINSVSTPSLFNEQLAILPSEISTRVVFFVLPPTTIRSVYYSFNEEAALRSAYSTTHEILEAKYNASVRFDSSSYGSEPTAAGTSQLGYDFAMFRRFEARPELLWTINECGNRKTMVVYYRTWTEHKYDLVRKSRAIWQSADTVAQSLINNWNDFTDLDTQSMESSPIECIFPLIRELEAYFLSQLGNLKYKLQYWLDPGLKDPPSSEAEIREIKDADLALAWVQSRGAIEGFELITQNLEDYQEGTLGIRGNDKIQHVIDRHRKRLKRARELEQYARDLLSWKVGRVALEESRKSIQQSNTLGKLSVLAYIFLPISLVTSFFGMNINELTGSGASWKAFFIAAGTLCGLGFLTFLWVFRQSDRLMFFVSIFFSPPFLILRCLIRGLSLMNLDHGSLFDWLSHQDFSFFYDFRRQYHSLFPRSE